jgi:ferrous iron transport protein B
MSHCPPEAAASADAARRGAHGDRARDGVTVALIGRPNAGKSSLFNRLTGGDAHVGNFPGITVDILEAETVLPSGVHASIVDVPGLYSVKTALDPQSDEGIAKRFIVETNARGEPLLLVQVLDANQLALGLRLTRELIQLRLPLLVVLTQTDVLRAEGRDLDVAALVATTGIPAVAVNSRDPASRAKVFEAIDDAVRAGLSTHDAPRDDAWDPDQIARDVVRDRADADEAVKRRRTRTARADRWFLHPVIGPVLFVAIMTTIFAAVYLVADPVTTICDAGVQWAGTKITRLVGHGLFASFVSDGVLGGAGTVLAFLPQIVILTIAMELLEATGYLARGAFLVDRALRAVGLGGRAFVPLLTAHACAVPAIAATRIMRDPRERLTTMLVLPLMTCSARIPTYSLLISTFFAARGAWFKSAIFVALYFAGIASGLLASALIRRSATKGRRLPLVLEMPAYRAPESRVVARVAGRAAARFVREVGTMILVASIALWALLTIPLPGATRHDVAGSHDGVPTRVERMQHSVAAGVGHALEPITAPLGFDWRVNVGLIGSFGARELMVSTLGVIFGIENADDDTAPLTARIRDARRPDGRAAYSIASGLALMAFFVLACQCMSTVAAIRRETKSWRWPAFVVAYTYVAAYFAAFVVFQIARHVGLG